MKIGIQTNVWTDERHRDLENLLSEVAEAGYDGLEIGAHRVDLEDPQEFKSRLARHNLQVAGMHTHGPLFDAPAMQAAMEGIRKAAHFAAAIDASYVLISGKPMEGGKTDADLHQEVNTLSEAGRICQEAGVHLLYHNHYWEIEDNLRELRAILDGVPSSLLSLALDVAWVTRAAQNPIAVIELFKDRVRYLHLKDFRVKDFLTDTWTDLGEGYVDLPGVIAEARSLGEMWLTYERDEALEDALTSAINSRRFLRQFDL